MSEKHNIFHGQFARKKNHPDGFVPTTAIGVHKYSDFLKNLQEDQTVEIFMEANKDDGTLAQIAKAKVCIRELAITTGASFDDMQLEVKSKAGLCLVREIEGARYMIVKSFAKCSKEEMSLAIQAIKDIGEQVGCNFN